MSSRRPRSATPIWVALILVLLAAVTLGLIACTLPAANQAAGAIPTPSLSPSAEAIQPTAETLVATVMTETLQPVYAGEVCRLDKVATAYEIYDQAGNYLGPQRMEIGGGGVQQADLYPRPQVLAVSYIVPPQEPIILMGHGSLWEAPNSTACHVFDWVTDTIRYANDRLNNGHSGLVVDLRSGSPMVVANLQNLTQDQIGELMSHHATAATGNVAVTDAVGVTTPVPLPTVVRGTATSVPSAPVPLPTVAATNQPQAIAGCTGTTDRWAPVVGATWPFTLNGPGVLNFWSNEPDVDQAEKTMLLRPGNYFLFGGGTLTEYPIGCESIAMQEMIVNGLPQTTYEEWVLSRGLARQ